VADAWARGVVVRLSRRRRLSPESPPRLRRSHRHHTDRGRWAERVRTVSRQVQTSGLSYLRCKLTTNTGGPSIDRFMQSMHKYLYPWPDRSLSASPFSALPGTPGVSSFAC